MLLHVFGSMPERSKMLRPIFSRMIGVDLVRARRKPARPRPLPRSRRSRSRSPCKLLHRPRRGRGHDAAHALQPVLAEFAQARLDLVEHRDVGVVLLELNVELELGVHVGPQGLAAQVVGQPLHLAEDLALGRALEGRALVLDAEVLARVPEVGFEKLADVHAARNAQRVQNDVDRRAVREERHVLHGHDAGDNALVAVAARHLVADHQLALLGDVDLDRHVRARRQLVARDLEQGLLGPVADQPLALLRLLVDVVDATARGTCTG